MSVAVQPHLSAVDALRYGPRLFAGPADEPRARRASDAIALAVALFVLLAGIMPFPGGVGVAEGGLTFGLVQTGIPEEIAFAIALMYRMASFYLPPIWGWFAFRWLQRNKHL
jgi:uncharacterized protein (TIRG00374 family)